MRLFRSARWLLLALLLPLITAPKAHAGVFISVNFGPPVLPVYVQPPCPEPNLMWTPGYWAYGPDGYYWVPGAWVPAPYVGALWTPPYWGFESGAYLYHPGYWGPHVGYYGGINYGFGYMGVGFVGGMWSGGAFRYNTAIINVNRTVIRNVYEDRTIVQRNTIMNNGRVAFNGGPNGVRYSPSAQERSYMNERHMAPTSFQSQHADAARNDRAAYARNNGGRPQNVAANRPLQGENRGAQGMANRPAQENRSAGNFNQNRPAQENRSAGNFNQNRAAGNFNQQRTAQESRPAMNQQRPAQESRPMQQSRPAEQRPAQQARPEQSRSESRPAPQHQAPARSEGGERRR